MAYVAMASAISNNENNNHQWRNNRHENKHQCQAIINGRNE
jgi:hypothetical protein